MPNDPTEKSPQSLALRLLMEDWQRAGIDDLVWDPSVSDGTTVQSESPINSSEDLSMAKARPADTDSDQPISESGSDSLPGPVLAREDRVSALASLQQQVSQCRRCTELAEDRTQTVFGVGDPMARLCFFGEAPGADEDRLGEPFVGRAGKLLTKIIEACELKREDVYILNVLKCRPPGNRAPLPQEAENCYPFLQKQLEIIRPEFLCCLGASAAKALLDTKVAIGKLRGKFYNHQGIRVLVTYHPAYLLRNPAAKRPVWEDMQLLINEMGIELNPTSTTGE